MSNRLVVAAALIDNDSVVELARDALTKLGIAHGDVVLLTQSGRKTVAVAHLDESDDAKPGVAHISTFMRRNLHVDIGDEVSLSGLGGDVPYGRHIHVLPIDDTLDDNVSRDKLFEDYLQPYFAGTYRPVHQGDLLLVPSDVMGGPDVEFVVVATNPKPYCIVGPDTDIIYDGAPVSRVDVL
ncbi:hypothetical protein BBJ28_00012823 [Nothophytophthora sp. Chile5]|nr:hypothetical protein BBJ28_00012823 [Nothophytophthora sp. Chile5]